MNKGRESRIKGRSYVCVIVRTTDVEGLRFSSVVHEFLPEKISESLVNTRFSADKGGQI